jgi:hypothetical protein
MEKGELRILGRRHTAIDVQTLCNHLDTLVGLKVAEVIMHNLEFRLGKLDASKLKNESPSATLRELVDYMTKTDRLSGLGVTTVTWPENQPHKIEIEIRNPSVKGSVGAAKAFAFSWWAGALTAVLGVEMEAKSVSYDTKENALKGHVARRENNA